MADLRPGDLVEITRASIGIPAGTVALIIERHAQEMGARAGSHLYMVWPTGEAGKHGLRRYLARDLERLTNT